MSPAPPDRGDSRHPVSGTSVRPPPDAPRHLRDEFAMAALTGLVVGRQELVEVFAKEAYAVADAMMEARKR